MRTEYENCPASFWARAAALLIDRAILFLPLLPVRLGAWQSGGAVFFRFTLAEVICAAVSILYFTLLTWRGGATLGKRCMNLQVVREDGEKLRFFNCLYRESIGRYLSSLFYIGYFLAAVDSRRQALHDMLCDTQVVYSVPVRVKEGKKQELRYFKTDDPVRDWYKPYRY
ncbi:MAG: RDD family protein [Oscillospiraceae bacterium]|nr:RDD family protein [Oscillospiraceae bacterium]